MFTAAFLFLLIFQEHADTVAQQKNFQGRIEYNIQATDGNSYYKTEHYGEKIMRDERHGDFALKYPYSDFYYPFDSTSSWAYSSVNNTWTEFKKYGNSKV